MGRIRATARFRERAIRVRGDSALPGALLFILLVQTACGTAGGTPASSPPPPSTVTVTVAPATASLFLGQSQTFTATVSGTTNPAVSWSVNGIVGGNTTVGTITSQGVYTAPSMLPSNPNVTVTATSQANPQVSGSATVTIKSDLRVTLSPTSVTLTAGQSQSFTAQVAGTGTFNPAVNWSLQGSTCPSSCGTISSTATTTTYTAPTSVSTAFTVTLRATSVADPSQSAAATITVQPVCAPPITISPASASVALGQQVTFTASVCFSSNQTVSWSVAGASCSGSNCGVISSTGPASAVYQAPSTPPPTNPVQVIATSLADPSQSASAWVTVVSGLSVQILPQFQQLAVNHRAPISAVVSGTSNASVSWYVNGVLNGNPLVGQICLAGSNPCQPPTEPTTANVDYQAPSTLPSPATVTLVARSGVDPTAVGYGQIRLLAHVVVTVLPSNVVVAPGGMVNFVAVVAGTTNSSVSWTIRCAATACGSIDAGGRFTAPTQAPNPNVITVTATSADDPGQNGQATVALSSGPAIATLLPASVSAGPADAVPVLITGFQFASGTASSVLLLNGNARPTSCSSNAQCVATLSPADLAQPAVLSLTISNPDGSQSNAVPFVVVPPPGPAATFSLTADQPLAAGVDVVTVEPTTAASGSPPLSLLFVGLLDTASNTCTVTLSPLSLARPASGNLTVTICLGGYHLDPSLQLAWLGGAANDPAISNVQAFNGSLLAMTLTLSPSTPLGPRTLVVSDADGNAATLTGAIEVIQP